MSALHEPRPQHLKNELTYEERYRKEKYDAAKMKEQRFNESREKFTKIKEQIAEERLKLIQIEKEQKKVIVQNQGIMSRSVKSQLSSLSKNYMKIKNSEISLRDKFNQERLKKQLEENFFSTGSK